MDVRIKMFGGFSIVSGNAEVGSADTSSPLLWDLLAYLITFRAREVPQSELMEALWGESELRNPQSALKVLVHRARGVLDGLSLDSKALLVGLRGSYRWDSSAVTQELDTELFERLLSQADASRDEDAACSLRLQAIGLYPGEFLSNLSSENWVMVFESMQIIIQVFLRQL